MTLGNEGNERIDRFVVASALLHAALFAAVILSPKLFPTFGSVTWGSPSGGSGGIKVKAVGSLSGVPLPTPAVVRENAPANDSSGFYKSPEPAPPPPPDDTAVKIPETKAPVKATPKPKPDRAAPPAAKSATEPEPAPSNAVPFGQGGRPSLAYGQFSTGAGEAGVGFGDSAFGDKYGTYVDAMTRRISQNWLKSMVDSRVASAPRVYLEFDIAREGSISNVEVKQSSGIPSLDRSAQRAILASNPFQSLPSDYRGSSVHVKFYFEYSK